MDLREILVEKIDDLGPIRWTKSFGWICAHHGKKFFGGYQVIDENDLNLLLLLSPADFEKAMELPIFEKFEFGKTWVVAEITSEEELDRVWPFVLSASNFAKERAVEKK